jgi:hypothetical protein
MHEGVRRLGTANPSIGHLVFDSEKGRWTKVMNLVVTLDESRAMSEGDERRRKSRAQTGSDEWGRSFKGRN